MNHARQRLLWVAGVYLLLAAAGTWLAVQEQLPAGFLGILNGHDPWKDFPLQGTALSAPLSMLILHAVLMFFLARGSYARACATGLALLGCLYTAGQIGEPVLLFGRAFLPVFHPEVAFIAIANVLCPSAMIVLGLQARRS